MIKTRWGFGLTAAVALGVIGVFAPSASGGLPFGLARAVVVQPEPVPGWVRRIALVDDALRRSDLSRAVYEWREARGAALRRGDVEGFIAVGDRAIRIAERAGGSAYFLREAREAYVYAAFRARTEGSRDTVLRIAESFERRGDAERAAQVRHLAASMSASRHSDGGRRAR